MSLVESKRLDLGSKMSSFKLYDPNGKYFSSDEFCKGSNGLLVVFTCNHCPYAIAIWKRLIGLSEYILKNKIKTIAINPNINPDYPEDSPEEMLVKIKEWGIKFPYLIDKDQIISKLFGAVCTPDIYFFDRDQLLIYHGRFDDNWKDENNVRNEDLKLAIDTYVLGEKMSVEPVSSIGCSIKWV